MADLGDRRVGNSARGARSHRIGDWVQRVQRASPRGVAERDSRQVRRRIGARRCDAGLCIVIASDRARCGLCDAVSTCGLSRATESSLAPFGDLATRGGARHRLAHADPDARRDRLGTRGAATGGGDAAVRRRRHRRSRSCFSRRRAQSVAVATSFFPKGGILAEQSNTDAFDNKNARGRLADLDPVIREWSSEPVFGEGFGTRPVDGRGIPSAMAATPGCSTTSGSDLLLETGAVRHRRVVQHVLHARDETCSTREEGGTTRGTSPSRCSRRLVSFAVAMLFLDAFGFPPAHIRRIPDHRHRGECRPADVRLGDRSGETTALDVGPGPRTSQLGERPAGSSATACLLEAPAPHADRLLRANVLPDRRIGAARTARRCLECIAPHEAERGPIVA